MSEAAPSRRLLLAGLPVAIFAALAAIFWIGLSGNPSEVPSALIGKPVPAFELPPIEELGIAGFKDSDLRQGKVTVVNVWASWCVPCRDEHPLLTELAKRSDIRLFGINNKDEPENARRFLGTLGQPFAAIGSDRSGSVSIDWGVYGVPETFVVDGNGMIRFKWIGPLSPESLTGKLAEEIEKAKTPLPSS